MSAQLMIPEEIHRLSAVCLESPIGHFFALSRKDQVLQLTFIEKQAIAPILQGLISNPNTPITVGHTALTLFLQEELNGFFAGRLKHFETPYLVEGTPFQQQVFGAISKIPYGKVKSYLEVAFEIGHPTAARAVANACAANQIAVLIPCHRIIRENQDIGGYRAGKARKKALLALERVHALSV